MTKYSKEFKIKAVKEYLESNISYKSLPAKYCIPSEIIIKNWVNAYKSQGYEGLKSKKIGRPSKMSKSPNKSKDTKVESSANISNSEDTIEFKCFEKDILIN